MFQKGYTKILVLSVFILTMLFSSMADAKELSAAEKQHSSVSSLAQMAIPNSSHSCSPVVTGNKPGVNGTTHKMAFDGSVSSFFDSSHDNWQFIQIDFQCTGIFSGLRRYMTRDGDDVSCLAFI